MITFLPLDSFDESVSVLDRLRLNSQRREAKAIYNMCLDVQEKKSNSRWRNQPMVRMWLGYEEALLVYWWETVYEWQRRGYQQNYSPPLIANNHPEYPKFMLSDRLFESHRNVLARKSYEAKAKGKPLPKDYDYSLRWNLPYDPNAKYFVPTSKYYKELFPEAVISSWM